MANVYAVKNGNWSDPTVWNTGALPTTADDVYPNNFTVTVNQNITVLSLRNGVASPIVAGGTFALANGIIVTVTANIGFYPSAGTLTRITGSDTATINGNIGGGLAGTSLLISQSANITISGSVIGNTGTGANSITHASSGILIVTGSASGGTGTNTHGITLSNSGSINILGLVTGGTSTTAHGINSTSTGTITITGSITGGTSTGNGVNLTSTGILLAYGRVQASIGTSGIISSAASTIQLIGPVSSSITFPGVQSTSATATNIFTGPFYNTRNYNAVFAQNLQLISGSTPTWTFDTETYGTQRTLYTDRDPQTYPSASDVRSGITYGATNELTGSVIIPPTSSVTQGVLVDTATGSASFTIQNAWTTPTSSLTGSTAIGTRLKNTATVANVAAAISSKGTI
jgi:hypothetical protein